MRALQKYKLFHSALVLFFWLGVWAILSRSVGQALLLPSPAQVLRRLFQLVLDASFWTYTACSLLRVSAGMIFAVMFGLLLAILTHYSRLCRQLIAPVITLIKTTPVASFIVLALVWLGRDVVPVYITGLIVLPVVWANLSSAFSSIDPKLLEMTKVFSLSASRRFQWLTLPSVLPALRAALCSALGLGWKAGIAAEILTVPKRSIGRMIYESKLYLETTDLFAWTLCVIILSLLIERLLLRLIAGLGKGRERSHA